MTGPLSPPASAASSDARASFPFCNDRPWHSRQCRARIGAISASKTLAAAGSRGRAGSAFGRPGSGIGPSPFQISIPERFAAPPRVVSRIDPESTTTRQGPSRFHVPAGPLT